MLNCPAVNLYDAKVIQIHVFKYDFVSCMSFKMIAPSCGNLNRITCGSPALTRFSASKGCIALQRRLYVRSQCLGLLFLPHLV